MNQSLRKSRAFLLSLARDAADDHARSQASERAKDRSRLILFNKLALAFHVIPPIMKLVILLWHAYFWRGWCHPCPFQAKAVSIMLLPLLYVVFDIIDKIVAICLMAIHFFCIPSIRLAMKNCCVFDERHEQNEQNDR